MREQGAMATGHAPAPVGHTAVATCPPPWGLEGVSVRLGRRLVLRDVTVRLTPGTVTVVTGGDGAGKSTLLRVLAGVQPPAAGRVRRPPRERIGVVAAGGVYTDLTVEENLRFVAAAYGLGGGEREARAAPLLAAAGLAAARDRLAGRLSGGMRQKLALVLALLHRPDLLVLDEPTHGVDPVSRAELWRLLTGAAAEGAAVVLSTTSLDEAQRAAWVVVLDGGRVAAAGPPDAVVAALPHPRPATSRRRTRGGGPPLASAERVSRRFGRLLAVDAVDLDVRPGEVVGLLGANGAGKTTLVRLLLGLLSPSAGRVRLFGAAPTRQARRRLGYVPQGLGLWEDLSVDENLAFVAAAFGCRAPVPDPDLAAVRDQPVATLPLGLRRRLAFLAALAHEPELLLLDEPTSGVDAAARASLWETVHRVADAGAGVLVTTHHLEEAAQCDRLVVLAAGRVVATGSEAALVAGHAAVEVAPADADAAPADAAWWRAAYAALRAAGLPVALHGRTLRVAGGDVARVRAALAAAAVRASLRPVPATLEEVFALLAAGTGTPPVPPP